MLNLSNINRNYLFSGIVALVVSVLSFTAFSFLSRNSSTIQIQHINNSPSKSAVYTVDENGEIIPLDFTVTAEKVIDGVVHIKSTQIGGNSFQSQSAPNPFKDFFGDEFEQFFGPQFKFENPNSRQRSPARIGTGSGVVISDEGYIVTNNHVISDADDIEVTLHDNRTFKATVIGTDPSTDLALLRIKADDLVVVPFVNSDEVKVGEWVMAVGNPFSLNSTVTAGIVSAKGRNINILKEQYAVENFIQTDAAINPGNSGGALVNLSGGLIGINTAIASPTGAYSGYGFAVPTNIVQKVVEDLIQFGTVQRGVLGIMIRTVDGNFAKEKGLNLTQGVYVDSLMNNSAAGKAGVKAGDVITKVNDKTVNNSPELQGMIARYRPGEKVKLTIDRKGKVKDIEVILNNRNGNTELATKDTREIIKILGAELEDVDKKLAKQLNIDGGVKVKKLYAGKLRKSTQMREGFIITHADGHAVKSVDDLAEILENKKGGVMIEGVYEDLPGEYYYAFGLDS